MKLFIIRHAEAVDSSPDAKRELSAHGREQVEELVRFFKKNGKLQPSAVWHSPLVRAVETADLLAEGLGWDCQPTETPGLTPEDDPRTIARKLGSAPGATALVGHEPHLSGLASFLLAGHASPPVIALKKAACLCLEGEGDYWQVRWMVVPGLL